MTKPTLDGCMDLRKLRKCEFADGAGASRPDGAARGVRRTTLLAASVLIVSAAGGCEAEVGSSAMMAGLDSASVEVVESGAAMWSEADGWRVRPEPVLSIGQAEGGEPYQLFRVTGALRLDDGALIVANGGSSELRFYDASGAFVRSVGGPGSGPGEFEALGRLMRFRSDSLAVHDRRLNRLSIFDSEGRFARTIPLASDQIHGFADFVGLVGGKALMTVPQAPLELPESGVHKEVSDLVLLDLESQQLSRILRVEGSQRYVARDGDRATSISSPFDPGPYFAPASDGFYHGSSDSFTVGWYGDDGRLRRLVRHSGEQVPLARATIDGFRDAVIGGAQDPQRRESMERLFGRMSFPATYPAYHQLLADDLGNLWVREYASDGEEAAPWSVFDTNGRYLGRTMLPRRNAPWQIGDDFVLTTERDELGVEYVRMYRLIKP